MSRLDHLATEISGCVDCQLHSGRTMAVPGEGPEDAKVVFIGEGPGFREDQQGKPFVGAAGQLLNQLLSSIELERKDVFITNVVKCRPPNNRDPLPAEMLACKKWLDQQLNVIKPRIVVTLGRYSLTRFFPNETISSARGKARKINGITYFPMYHPAAALRQQRFRKVIEDDFKTLSGLIALSESERATKNGLYGLKESEQLSMF